MSLSGLSLWSLELKVDGKLGGVEPREMLTRAPGTPLYIQVISSLLSVFSGDMCLGKPVTS